MIVVARRASTLAVCDRIIGLEDGQVVEDLRIEREAVADGLPVRVRVRQEVQERSGYLPSSLADQILTFEAAYFLAIARTWLSVVPFRKIAETLGTNHSAAKLQRTSSACI